MLVLLTLALPTMAVLTTALPTHYGRPCQVLDPSKVYACICMHSTCMQVLDPSKVQRPLTAIVGGAKISDK